MMDKSEIETALGFDTMPNDVRGRYTPICPFSICKETRNKIAGYSVMDMRSGKRVRVTPKREANEVAKLIEDHFYSAPREN